MVDYIRSKEEIDAVEKQQRKLDLMQGAKKNEELADMKRREEERLARRKASATFENSASMFGQLEQAAVEEPQIMKKKKSKTVLVLEVLRVVTT